MGVHMSCYGWAYVTTNGYGLGVGTNSKENVGLWSKVVAHNDLRLLSQSGHVNRYANEFQHLCSRIPKFFFISTSYKVKRFLAKLKENVRNKVLMDPKGVGGPWGDIKCLIHHAITINTTYA